MMAFPLELGPMGEHSAKVPKLSVHSGCLSCCVATRFLYSAEMALHASSFSMGKLIFQRHRPFE